MPLEIHLVTQMMFPEPALPDTRITLAQLAWRSP
jgi:hypothetical protein